MICAGIATIPSRINQVKRTIDSLLPQVDLIFVALNNFTAIPWWLSQDRVICYLRQGSDEQKFLPLGSEYVMDSKPIFLSCDDDLIYPSDYVRVMKERLEHYDIVTCHGRNFNSFPIQSYYKSAGSKYRCLDKVSTDIPVMIGGTGCMAFRPWNPDKPSNHQFNISLADFPSKYMADIHFSIKARKEGKKIMCIAHEAGWIKYQPVENTIYDRFRDNDFEQTERINEAFAVTV